MFTVARAVSSAPESSLNSLRVVLLGVVLLSVEKGKWDVTRELLQDGEGEGGIEK